MKLRAFALFALVWMAGLGRAVTIMDQIGPDNSYTPGWVWTSQYPEDLPFYGVVLAENFNTTSAGYIITSVEAVIGFYNPDGPGAGPDQVTAYFLNFYSSPDAAGNNLAGDVGHYLFGPEQLTLIPWATDRANQHLVRISGLSLALEPNRTYWVGLIPVMPRTGRGWVGIGASLYPGWPANGQAIQANPLNGFGNGPWWVVGRDFAYRVTAVPEPATLAILGFGALALIRRRR